MDHRPFLILDLLDADAAPVEEVAKFVKSEFNPEAIRASANELKYTRAIKSELQQEVTNPSEEFVRLLMGRVYSGVKTKTKLEQFTSMTRRAARQLIRDELRGTLNTALAQGDPTAPEVTSGSDSMSATEESEDDIITTEAELNGYY
ncbi:MAG: restriction endonuclease, partial [Chloroflexi bacterium]|nr:restriction endonuclease [Chloroflexota bacterium]